MRSAQKTILAFTLVEMMVVVAFIALLVILAIPSFAKARTTALKQTCLENQRVIYNATVQYEMDTGNSLESIKMAGASIRDTLVNSGYVKNKSTFQCPAVRPYTWDRYVLLYDTSHNFTNTACWNYSTTHIPPAN